MRRFAALALLAIVFATATPDTASAQAARDDGWMVTVYPVLAWVPLGLDIDVDVPPHDGSIGGSGSIVEGRFDGAFLGGVSAARKRWRFDGDIIWAGVGGDRIDRPELSVDADVIYGHAMAGYEFARDFYVTGGVRRLAIDYDIKIGDQPNFSRKPAVWDPLIGVGWHRTGTHIDWHAVFEGGGFGVGADIDLGAGLRFDWKPVTHFGVTAGYNYIYFKITDSGPNADFVVKQTIPGPVVGVGLYF